MNIPFLTSTRRNFLRHCGLLAGTSVAPVALAGAEARCLSAPGDPDWLRAWNALPRQPVRESSDTIVAACLEAAGHGGTLSLYYHGGTTPGQLRRFSPDLLFQLPLYNHRYVSGYCHLRQAPRILRADRIALA